MLTTAQRNEFLALIQKDFALADDWENLKNYAKDTKAHWSVCIASWSLSIAIVANLSFASMENIFIVMIILLFGLPVFFVALACVFECCDRLVARDDMKDPSRKIWAREYVKRQRAEKTIRHYAQHMEKKQIVLAQVHPNCRARAAKLLENELNRRKHLKNQSTKSAILNVETMFHQS